MMVSKADSIDTHDEADISVISYMLDVVRHGASTVRILSDDTDVFVIMVYWCWKAGITTNLQMEKWNGTVLSINATAKNLGDHCCSILAMHALSGCDTTSYPVGKGKVSALKAMTIVPGKLLHCIGEAEATDLQITKATRTFFLALYNQRNSVTLDAARYDIYRKRKRPPALKTLPPTERNMHLHGRRAHLQVLLWKAADQADPPAVDITLFGWDKKMGLKEGEELIMPTQDSSPVAPPALLDVVSCGCRAGLKPCTSAKCSCAAAGLACTSYCSCKGNDGICCNILTQQQEHKESDEGSGEDDDRTDEDSEDEEAAFC